MKKIILIVAGMVVIVGLYIILASPKEAEPIVNEPYVVENGENIENADLPRDTSNGMRVEQNAVVATEQRPNKSVTIAQVYLSAPGYVVIREDNDGVAGDIIGTSAVLKVGQNDKVTVTLSRSTNDGDKLWAMLHSEMNSNTTFDAASDTAVESSFGGPISGWFEIRADADENFEVTL